MESVDRRDQRLDWLAGTIVAVLGVPVIVVGAVGTLYGFVRIGHPGSAPLPGAAPPDFLSEYGFVLAFAAIGLWGVLQIVVGIGVARHHQLARLIALLTCIAGIWFAWTLLQNFLHPVAYIGPKLVPYLDTTALLGSLVFGVPLLIAAACLVITIVRRADLRR